MSDTLTHLDDQGRAHMVDVSEKDITERIAVAEGTITMEPETLARIVDGDMPKGDVLAVARVAGIMAAKRTPDLIPLCHPLSLSKVTVELEPDHAAHAITIRATCKLKGRTGVEMEALTAVTVAGLTVYDMCKAVDRDMTIGAIQLVHKSGGKSGTYQREA
ncbi:MAG: cyclic pyranopterin monophosphate synthase MoaC [Rhodospirillaceae bacterium]|nr:cyclic pyranopterin monophosphate synthase MoaC [Rhodospirillaceae bacterium]|tara:strand:- start:182 stop:664 length:483 start_codon:yes stop_codon:yes gene_type:complete